ncbi:MAG: hypothetical protein AABZ32_01520 [Bacteroidota bacterium]
MLQKFMRCICDAVRSLIFLAELLMMILSIVPGEKNNYEPLCRECFNKATEK